MEPNFEDPANKLLSDIVEALRLRYAYQNDISRPMLNSPVREGTPDAELLVKRVIIRLDAAHQANYMVEQLLNLAQPRPWLGEKDVR